MILRNKLVPVALGAALLGGSAGALIMRPSSNSNETAQVASATKTQNAVANPNVANPNETQTLTANAQDSSAFRDGFVEGVRAAREEGLATTASVAPAAAAGVATASSRTNERVVYRNNAPRSRNVRSRRASNQRQVYYDYSRPRKRSFWNKHRDKLTVGIGAGSGALIGGLIGGKKGALIGAAAGGGGAALYTYKLRDRKRNRRY